MPCSSPSFRPPAQPSGRARLSQCAVRLFPHHDVISAAHTTEIIRRRSPGLPETPPWVACRFFCRFARPPHLVTARRARQAAAAVAGSQHGRHVALEKLRQPSRHNHAHLLPLFPGGSRWRQHHSCQFYTPPPPRRLSKLIPLRLHISIHVAQNSRSSVPPASYRYPGLAFIFISPAPVTRRQMPYRFARAAVFTGGFFF